MAWVCLVLAGLCEMFGVAMINKVHRDRGWLPVFLLVVGFGASFVLLSIALQSLPMGTAYAIWTGIGAAGGAVVGMVWYGESRDWKRIVFIAMILGASVGLKLIS